MKKNNKPYSISIIIPFLNEINSLKKTIKILDKIQIKKEYLIIYSKNLTNLRVINILKILEINNKNIKLFFQKKPYVGGAIDTGIKNSSYDYIAIMASDLETDPNNLKYMINLSIKYPLNIISADRWISKRGFNNYGALKYTANFIFQKLIKLLFKHEILDFTYAYRIYPKKILKNYELNELKHGFALEILLNPLKKGFQVTTFPTKWKKRIEGKSSISFLGYLSYLRVLIRSL